MFVRGQYNYSGDDVSKATGIEFLDPSLTKESQAEDADINVIVSKYVRTGQLPDLSRRPEFGDFTGISDYRTALHAVQEAQELFSQLPAAFRLEFGNDPAAFLEYMEKGGDERLVKYGLAEASEPEQAAITARNPDGIVGAKEATSAAHAESVK